MEKQIESLIKKDERLVEMIKYATSVDGVGFKIAVALIAATNEFKNVKTGRQLACYIGVAPFPHQSGTSVSGPNRVSHLANKILKRLLHLGAISAITHIQEFKAYYERKLAEGKSKMSIINAVRNQLILRIFVCVGKKIMCQRNC